VRLTRCAACSPHAMHPAGMGTCARHVCTTRAARRSRSRGASHARGCACGEVFVRGPLGVACLGCYAWPTLGRSRQDALAPLMRVLTSTLPVCLGTSSSVAAVVWDSAFTAKAGSAGANVNVCTAIHWNPQTSCLRGRSPAKPGTTPPCLISRVLFNFPLASFLPPLFSENPRSSKFAALQGHRRRRRPLPT
jgi:hypothetical protein